MCHLVVVVDHKAVSHSEARVAAQRALQDCLWVADVEEV